MKCNNIYLAARYSRKPEMQDVASTLVDRGYRVTSNWIQENYDPNVVLTEITDEDNRKIALVDLEDILSADAMLFFAEDPLIGIPRGGRHVEFGYAMALNLEIYVIGPKENIFHYLEGVKHFETFEAFLEQECRA